MEKGKKRLAVLVGCNYPNTQYELHGCINDVLAMREVLVKRFGFDPQNVELLMDAPGSPVLPTGTNVKAALDRMVDRAEAGDVLFFHYSGHGTRIPRPRHKLPLWQDEAIVPCDFNLITGNNQYIEKEQIGPYTALCDGGASLSHAPRTIPFNSLLHHLSSLTKINTSDIGTHLLECFGSEASLRFRRTLEELDAPIDLPVKPDEGILLSGCQAEETSADMSPSAAAAGGAGKAYGAFSNAVQIVLRENAGRRLSNREVVAAARAVLRAQGFAQHPCLYCSDENADAPFLWRPEPAEE
ncbi:hypothetical protein CRG98_020690 [Punica granatum]|uniref:Peptidase C14 caspase domain-containing protein n=1 Tax=Punica granatum TaxID=22663 RepID=A0A2I0JRM4_PUNGR|nr:hypothetical protein CRG98_020690 [Punica granatum]